MKKVLLTTLLITTTLLSPSAFSSRGKGSGMTTSYQQQPAQAQQPVQTEAQKKAEDDQKAQAAKANCDYQKSDFEKQKNAAVTNYILSQRIADCYGFSRQYMLLRDNYTRTGNSGFLEDAKSYRKSVITQCQAAGPAYLPGNFISGASSNPNTLLPLYTNVNDYTNTTMRPLINSAKSYCNSSKNYIQNLISNNPSCEWVKTEVKRNTTDTNDYKNLDCNRHKLMNNGEEV